MSARTKACRAACGQFKSPLRQFKSVWRGLSDDARDYWRAQLTSSRPQADLWAEILAEFNLRLSSDSELNQFRDWLHDQDRRDTQSARAKENEARIKAEHPDWTLDQLRGEVLKQSYLETLAAGDFKLGLKTVAQDVNVKRVALDEAKVLEAMKTGQASALEFCLEEAREFPAVQELFRQAFAALKAAQRGMGAPVSDPARLQINTPPDVDTDAPIK